MRRAHTRMKRGCQQLATLVPESTKRIFITTNGTPILVIVK